MGYKVIPDPAPSQSYRRTYEGPITDHLEVDVVWATSAPHWSPHLCWLSQAGRCLGLERQPAAEVLHGPTLVVWVSG